MKKGRNVEVNISKRIKQYAPQINTWEVQAYARINTCNTKRYGFC
jgi:hypothetical protein